MDSFEVNKILGAVLGTCLGLLSINIAAGAIFAPTKPTKPGYEIVVPEKAPSGQPAEPQKQEPIEQLLANADVGRGENAAKKCQACHTFNKGGRNLVGPNLWGVIGRPKGSEAGFNYSAALKAKGGTWTIDDMNQFINNPRGYIPGTNMTFAGIQRGGERADVIAYLNSLSDNPAPLPKAAEAGGGAKAQ
jgi:cytochrome c